MGVFVLAELALARCYSLPADLKLLMGKIQAAQIGGEKFQAKTFDVSPLVSPPRLDPLPPAIPSIDVSSFNLFYVVSDEIATRQYTSSLRSCFRSTPRTFENLEGSVWCKPMQAKQEGRAIFLCGIGLDKSANCIKMCFSVFSGTRTSVG